MSRKPNALKTSMELTPKQRKFVDIYVSNYGTISKVEAAKQAGYESKDKYGPMAVASRLTNPEKNPHVVRYLEKRLSQELAKYEKDKLRVYKTFDRLRTGAETKGQFTAAINAEVAKGKMAGFFIDRKEVTHVGLEGMSREQLEKRLDELESKIGDAKNIIDITPDTVIENK
jgi:phage terminase small subunit